MIRKITSADIPLLVACRMRDVRAGVDERMGAYFEGHHHPQKALAKRVGFLEIADEVVAGYVAGHMTTRFGYDGELQYLFVDPAHRRQGIARELVRRLARWFAEEGVHRVCVNVDVDSDPAIPFYERMGARPVFPDKRYWYGWEDVRALEARTRM